MSKRSPFVEWVCPECHALVSSKEAPFCLGSLADDRERHPPMETRRAGERELQA